MLMRFRTYRDNKIASVVALGREITALEFGSVVPWSSQMSLKEPVKKRR